MRLIRVVNRNKLKIILFLSILLLGTAPIRFLFTSYNEPPFTINSTSSSSSSISTLTLKTQFKPTLESSSSSASSDIYASKPTADVATNLAVTNPTQAYDDNLDTWAEFKTNTDGNFELKTFTTLPEPWRITRVDIKIKYEAAAASNDRLRITLKVDPSTTSKILSDWSIASVSLDTYSFWDIAEPNDGEWSWTDIANIRVFFESDVVAGADQRVVKVYEVWANIYYRNPTIFVDPPSLVTDTLFSIKINISEADNIYAWEFKLSYKTEPLLATEVVEGSFLQSGGTTQFNRTINDSFNATHGVVYAYASLLGDVSGISGNGTLATIDFTPQAGGESPLTLFNTKLVEYDFTSKIAYKYPPYHKDVINGYVTVSIAAHDVAIKTVTASPPSVKVGETVNVEVTAENQGDFTETFDVTTYADIDTEVIGDEITIGTKTVTSLASKATQTLTFTWITTGVSPGTYTVSAKASSVPGETDLADNTKTDGEVTVSALQPPIAAFTYSPTSPEVGDTVTFDASASTDPDGTITNFAWAFGDGATGSGQTTTHAYSSADTFTVTLTVTDNDELTDTESKTLTVSKITSSISINADPTSINLGESTTISGSITPTRPAATVIISYRQIGGTWSTLTTVTTNATSQYTYSWTPASEGTYELKASWAGDTITKSAESSLVTVTVIGVKQPPIASFIYNPPTPKVGDTVTFDASASTDPDGTIVSYSWDFGDGSPTGNGQIVTHIYSTAGEYLVTLTVTDNDGLTDTDIQTITIAKLSSTISINAEPTTINLGESTTISGAITPSRADAPVTIWYKPTDGTWSTLITVNTNGAGQYSYVWTPIAADTYELKASWEGDVNTLPDESDVITVTVTALQAPTASFTYSPAVPIVGEAVSFDASASTDTDGTIETYTWNFGDGTPPQTETDPLITHTYSAEDTYTVILTVTDNDGLTDTAQTEVTVKSAAVHDLEITNIAAAPDKVKPGETVSIDVTVHNSGTFSETFDITVYYNWTGVLGSNLGVAIDAGQSKTLTYTWDTNGMLGSSKKYEIVAEISVVEGETDDSDNYWDSSNPYYHPVMVTIQATIYLSPASIIDKSLTPGSEFTVDIIVANVSDLSAWEVKLVFDVEILFTDETMVEEGPFLPSAGLSQLNVGNNLPAYIGIGGFMLVPSTPSGSGTVATITFRVVTEGVTALNIYDTILLDNNLNNIPHTAEDSYFSNTGIHDIAITFVTASPTVVYVGESVFIDVTIENQGEFSETFDTTVYFGSTIIGEQTGISLDAEEVTTLKFTWVTTEATIGPGVVTAVASTVLGEIDADDNTYIDGTVTVLRPNQPPTASFTYSPTAPIAGEVVTFDASTSNDPDGEIVSYHWDFGDGSATTETVPIVTHTFASAGTYVVILTVTDDGGLTDTTSAEVVVSALLVHDIAVTNVEASPTTVEKGQTVTITVTIENQGDFAENFDVTVFYNGYSAAPMQTVTNLEAKGSITLVFTWDTADVDDGIYIIRAEASPVLGETDTLDNTYVDGSVTVKARFEVVVDGQTYVILADSNSTITNFAFDPTQNEMSFEIEGPPGTNGYLNVTVPKAIFPAPSEQWTFMFDDTPITPTMTENATHVFLYFTYLHSVHTITIIGRGIAEVSATVTVTPHTLNLDSKGKWITVYIELPEGYNVEDIILSSIKLNNTIPAVTDPKYGFVSDPEEYITDIDDDGIPERMVKFERAQVIQFIARALCDQGITHGTVTLSITGKLLNGISFQGFDTIEVIDKPDNKLLIYQLK